MKNGSKTKTYSVIAALLLLASCNEKVNPSLQESNTTTTTPPPVTVEKYFRLVNNSDSFLRYHLHKTGVGQYNSKCEVNTTAFSTDLYRAQPATYDVTCFLEAEELALYYNGIDWNIEASPNTCEYIGYAPYSFYQYQPGDSTRNVSEVSCASGIPSAPGNRPACGGFYQDDPEFQAGAPFDQIDGVASDQDLCRFDYSNAGGPNCDEGTITVTVRPFDYVIPGDNTSGGPIAYPTSTRRISCGGKSSNCTNGPIKDVSILSSQPYGTINIKSEKDEAASLSYSVAAPYSKGHVTNRYAANFSRQCTGVNYFNSSYGDIGEPLFAFTAGQTSFNPDVLDLLAKNYRRDYNHTNLNTMLYNYTLPHSGYGADPTLDPASINPLRFFNTNEKVKALATAPNSSRYVGDNAADGKGRKGTNPFYTFYCFNMALDTKARIRVMVRDWDREFVADPIMEVMSDVYTGMDSLMDNSYDELGNLDYFDSFNDIADWDDTLHFLNPVDDVVPANDIPACQVPYPHSVEPFSRDSFPEGRL